MCKKKKSEKVKNITEIWRDGDKVNLKIECDHILAGKKTELHTRIDGDYLEDSYTQIELFLCVHCAIGSGWDFWHYMNTRIEKSQSLVAEESTDVA
jgi:hypothetical protein